MAEHVTEHMMMTLNSRSGEEHLSQISRSNGARSAIPEDFNSDLLPNETFPEGGTAAWLTLIGCLFGWMTSYGLLGTVGTWQAYLETHQLKEHTPAEIGWIFGLYLFVTYFLGVEAGPVFDTMGPRPLTAIGSLCLAGFLFLLEACHGEAQNTLSRT